MARDRLGRPAHLLEKDVWVVWALNALFGAGFSDATTFKGGTTLSKVYNVIDRFSEDIDLTYDIRNLIPEAHAESTDAIPKSRSQASRWSKAVRAGLPQWIGDIVVPHLQQVLADARLEARLEQIEDKLLLHYDPLSAGTGYVRPVVALEFGARATGEPHQRREVRCDMAGHVEGVVFPTAMPLVMDITRTFWEKATAAHVYCAQKRIRGERYARHWHDLAAIARSEYLGSVLGSRDVAQAVANHKSCFFVEKSHAGQVIDYHAAVSGQLHLVPMDDARDALAQDYRSMIEDQVLIGDGMSFEQLMTECARLQDLANQAMANHEGGRR